MSELTTSELEATADSSHTTISLQPTLDAYNAHRDEVALRVSHMLKVSGGQPTDAVCHVIETYRLQTATFPLPLADLPCRTCPKRIEGH